MSITVNVVGQTNIVTSITNSDTVDVALGTMVAQTLTSLAIAGGANVTVTTTSGVFTIIGRDVPVSSVNGQTGAVALSVTDISAASAVHTHVAADVTNFAAEAAKYGPVTSVVGKTGAVTLSAAEVGAASASHTHVAANVTDFAAEAAKHGPVSSVAGKVGTVVLSFSDVSAAQAVHTHTSADITDLGSNAAPPLIWTTVTATGNLNNYAPGTATVLRIDPTSARLVTGIADGGVNKAVRIVNVATNVLTLVHASTSSDSQNRLLIDTGTDRDLDENDQAELLYDPISLRWRVTPCCGGSSS